MKRMDARLKEQNIDKEITEMPEPRIFLKDGNKGGLNSFSMMHLSTFSCLAFLLESHKTNAHPKNKNIVY